MYILSCAKEIIMKDQSKFNPNHNRLMHFQIGVFLILACVNFAFKSQWEAKRIVMPEVLIVPDNYHGVDILPELTKPNTKPQTQSQEKQFKQMVVVPDLTELAVANNEVTEPLPEFPKPNGPVSFIKVESKEPKIHYSIPDSDPLFPGGPNGIAKEIEKRLEYPEFALEDGVGCKMRIAIVIDAKGNVVGCEFISIDEDDYDFKSQVYNAVKKLKGFKPAVKSNMYVESKVKVDIHFILD